MTDWHPILATEEREPGVWTMVAPDGKEYGTVTIVRVDGEIRYRAVAIGAHVGHTTTLREACMRVHQTFLRSLGPGEPPGGYYPDLNGITKKPLCP